MFWPNPATRTPVPRANSPRTRRPPARPSSVPKRLGKYFSGLRHLTTNLHDACVSDRLSAWAGGAVPIETEHPGDQPPRAITSSIQTRWAAMLCDAVRWAIYFSDLISYCRLNILGHRPTLGTLQERRTSRRKKLPLRCHSQNKVVLRSSLHYVVPCLDSFGHRRWQDWTGIVEDDKHGSCSCIKPACD